MTVSVETCWALSKLWYPDRLQIDWQPKSEKRIQTIFHLPSQHQDHLRKVQFHYRPGHEDIYSY